MVDFRKFHRQLYGAPRYDERGRLLMKRGAPDHERYLEPVVAPLQAKQRLDSLESWLSNNQTGK